MEDFTNRHEKKIKCFKSHMKRFRNTFTPYPSNEIKYEWIRSAGNHYAKGVEYDKVVGLYEMSVFGKGKAGFLFTDDILYWGRTAHKYTIRLDDIEKITYYNESKEKDVDKGIVFHLKDGSIISSEGFCGVKCTPFIEFMNEYIKI